jgi:alcohol dehydrogenase class IV
MWFFKCPEFFFGEDALSQLGNLSGERVFIVTDANLLQLGYVAQVQQALGTAVPHHHIFAEVEPDPSLETIQRGAAAMLNYKPDWIIGLGGGSCMDAAKAMWVLYERPDLSPDEISPMLELGLRRKARLICIPTTAGTGSESNFAIILTDTAEHRKLTLANRETTPDIAIVDPALTAQLPASVTADTGIDVLTHAIEAYSCTWANDFTDGLCLQAARMVFAYLPRTIKNGANDPLAREKMANAAAIAGITLGNSSVALAHAMGHAAGAIFRQIPHGRITAIFLPYTIEFVANGGDSRYTDLALALGLPNGDEQAAAQNLATAVRGLMHEVRLPTCLRDAGISLAELEAALPLLCEHVDVDANLLMSRRIPSLEEIEQLFRYAYTGQEIDF